MSDETKVKLIYSGELLLFAIIFTVLGVLKITRVIGYNPTRALVFNYITLAGVAWGLVDFTWAIASKKRRARVSLLDKAITLPLSIFMLVFDLINIIKQPGEDFYVYMLSSALFYVVGIYIFMGVYHWFHPNKELLEAIEEDRKEKEKKEQEQNENKKEE